MKMIKFAVGLALAASSVSAYAADPVAVTDIYTNAYSNDQYAYANATYSLASNNVAGVTISSTYKTVYGFKTIYLQGRSNDQYAYANATYSVATNNVGGITLLDCGC